MFLLDKNKKPTVFSYVITKKDLKYYLFYFYNLHANWHIEMIVNTFNLTAAVKFLIIAPLDINSY
jgi:hypothetical protein